ncbi:pyrroline-5-carboxylate reductase [Trinickia dinghuensis]|uniref:Pyrroline-5-carboxylate reductase n=1 Tax=Trinickia dinghuensis TaxID=2291023 RepID=A0A3D8JTU3_9BURK|nr:pyrroline-5-carboxylate reductase [Trinickia dinghuensis]RDU96222.1 pyrroline-5-carboxylate reductase [Trinickia dinghuensis]
MSRKIGFIGTGSITEAVVTGLAKVSGQPSEVWLSPRNAAVAARLASQFPFVKVAAGNQEVLENCDIVCLAVLPQVAHEVLSPLRFKSTHHVLSFIATVNHVRLKELMPNVARITRLAPLPMVADLNGPTIIFPTDELATEIFAPLGEAICIDEEVPFDALCAATALMGSYFSMLETYTQWLTEKGVTYDSAKGFLATFYSGLGSIARNSADRFSTLAASVSTAGGLNEQVAKEMRESGSPEICLRAIENVYQRIRRA